MREQAGRVLGSIIFVLGCGMLLAADAKAIEYVVKKVALVGDPAPHATGTYSAMYSGVSLNGPGDVGYTSGLTGGGATQATWVAHPDGSFEVVLTTDTPPMLPGVLFSYMGVPRLNDRY